MVVRPPQWLLPQQRMLDEVIDPPPDYAIQRPGEQMAPMPQVIPNQRRAPMQEIDPYAGTRPWDMQQLQMLRSLYGGA